VQVVQCFRHHWRIAPRNGAPNCFDFTALKLDTRNNGRREKRR
jgi:hypothetical protein